MRLNSFKPTKSKVEVYNAFWKMQITANLLTRDMCHSTKLARILAFEVEKPVQVDNIIFDRYF